MPCRGKLGLNLHTTLQCLFEGRLELALALFAARQLRVEILPARFELADLRIEALEAGQQRLVAGAT